MSAGHPLQGYELVVHVFVAAEGANAEADYRYLVELWQGCVVAFGLTATLEGVPGEPHAGVPSIVDDERFRALRSSRVDGLHQVALRQVHDVLCLSLLSAPASASAWTALDARWRALRPPPTSGVLGAVRILQGRLSDPDAALDVAALAPVVTDGSGVAASWWRPGILRAEPPLGPFGVWEAVDDTAGQASRDGRAERCIAVVAPADQDPELSAWTWSSGRRALPPFARYLMHAAKLRYELRVRSASPVRPLRSAVDAAVDRLEPVVRAGGVVDPAHAESARADLDGLKANESRLTRRARSLRELRTTAQIAAENMAAHAGHDQTEGLFADDRDVAAWLDRQIDRDLSYLDGPAEEARRMVDALPKGITERAPRFAEKEVTSVADLSGRQRKLLIDALRKAYPSYRRLGILFGTEMDRNLADYAAEGPMPEVLFEAITQAEAEGWIDELITAAALGNPGNERLHRLVAEELQPQAGLVSTDVGGELQHVFHRAAGFPNLVSFATKLLVLAGRVCGVKIVNAAGRGSFGTGFLVGPDLVLTNYHVVADVIDGTTPPSGLRCLFDYHFRVDGSLSEGTSVEPAEPWLVAASPPSAVDTQAEPARPPALDELDYALIRVAGQPGRARMPDGRERGWIDLRAGRASINDGTPLLIIQHPEGHPLKLAVDPGDQMVKVNDDRTRFTHGVNTLPGSSGAPCLTFDLELVGLHHSWLRRVGRNEGIPIDTIVAHLPDDG